MAILLAIRISDHCLELLKVTIKDWRRKLRCFIAYFERAWEIDAYLFRPEKLERRRRDEVELCIRGQGGLLLSFVLYQRDCPILGFASVATKKPTLQSNATRARRLENWTPDRKIGGRLFRRVGPLWGAWWGHERGFVA